MTSDTSFQIPSGYERGIRFGANFTMIISPYLILYLILFFALGSPQDSSDIAATLEFEGNSPTAYKALVLLDGLSHALGFVMIVTLFAALRIAYPVQATLILVFGAWQMFIGFTKGLYSANTFTQLGSAYLAGDTTLRATLMVAANAAEGLRVAFERMDSLGVMFFAILVSLLPQSSGLPRAVRWLGWIVVLGLAAPDPAFLLVILFSPFWQFLLGRWMKRLTLAPKEVL